MTGAWTADEVSSVLTAAVYQHFTGRPGTLTLSSGGKDETFELQDSENESDVLTWKRLSDGALFETEFWVQVTMKPGGKP